MSHFLDMKKHGQRGILITFCGLDGCGKTTMIQMLQEKLQQKRKDVFLTKQPTDEMRQSHIFRSYMDSPDHSRYEYRSLSLMAAADRIQHANKVILPQLEAGRVVISDRYVYSCLANLHARGYANDQWIHEIVKDIPKPDLAFFLDTSVPQAMMRVRRREQERDRYIDVELQYRLSDEYRIICNANRGIWVASDQEQEKTFIAVWNYVRKYMEVKFHE